MKRKYDERILIDTTACQEPGEVEKDPSQRRVAHGKGFVEVLKVIGSLGLKNSFTNVFYRPSRKEYRRPEDLASRCTPQRFFTDDGMELHGWLLHCRGDLPCHGTVIQFHGCCHNMTFDAHQVDWLTEWGFNVFLFDYRGYGRSEGSPDREGIHRDGLAAMRHLRRMEGVDPARLFVLGQSLGGCICLAVMCDDSLEGVRGIAVDGTFGSYRSLVNTKMTNTRLTRPLASLIVSDELAPLERVETLSPTPILFFHGTVDKVILPELGRNLFARAAEPKTFLPVEGARHMETFTVYGDGTRPELVGFFKSCLEPGAA